MGYFLVLLLAALALAAGPALAKQWQKKERQNIIILGDRVVDIAYNLGVVPVCLSARCSIWPLCAQIQTLAQPLGCPACLAKGKREKLAACIKQHAIKVVIVEKSDPYCILKPGISPLDSVPFLEKQGVEIKYVDFSAGIESAIAQTAALVGQEKRGQELAAQYKSESEALNQKMAGVNLGKRVVILNGVYLADAGKGFMQVEMPGFYGDKFILEPLGCQNVGQTLVAPDAKPDKGYVTIRKLHGLAEAKPDLIVITGDASVVQKALIAAMAERPELATVPVLSLPRYIDSSVVERPRIVGQWLWALR